MNGTTATRSSQVRRLHSFRGARASLVTAIMAILFVVALPAGATFAAPPSPGPDTNITNVPGPAPQDVGPTDLQLCTEDCGPDDPPTQWPGDLEVCTEDCGPDDPPTQWPGDLEVCTEDCGGDDDGGENGNENGGGDDGIDDDIPVPTRIDTGNALADADGTANEFWVIAAVAAAVGLSALTYRSIRDQR
jgi:hypothetical protein